MIVSLELYRYVVCAKPNEFAVEILEVSLGGKWPNIRLKSHELNSHETSW